MVANFAYMEGTTPTSYQAFGEYLAISWGNGHESLLAFAMLRDNCPCANCRGEPDLLGRLHMPESQAPRNKAGDNLAGMQPVGRYGLQLIWGDGHNTGIYTFDYLRQLCDCDSCSAQLVSDHHHDGK